MSNVPQEFDELRGHVGCLMALTPTGLNVYVPREQDIAAAFSQELVKAITGDTEAQARLSLYDPQAVEYLNTRFKSAPDADGLEVAIQSLIHDGALQYAPNGSQLQSLTGYTVRLRSTA